MPEHKPEEFRLLSPEEFDRLSTGEKANYLRQAVEAQKAITDQIDRALAEIAKRLHDQKGS
jgi:hypothetical protein